MSIGMQGLWTVSVKSKEAGWSQRYRIAGSTNGADGVYDDSSPPLFVDGSQWGITVEHNPTGPVSWQQSRYRLANHHISGGQFHFDIETNDAGGDEDFNDLILTCSMALADSEYVVYGNMKSYSGNCLFNPCFPLWYYVIDTPWQLEKLLQYPETRRILEKLYPERIKPIIKRPFPEPDPVPFRPMMIPSGLTEKPGLNVARTMKRVAAQDAKAPSKKAAKADQGVMESAVLSLSANTTIGNTLLHQDELLSLARLRDQFRFRPCRVEPISQTLMRFVEYDRTAAEKLGDPYLGDGDRHILGVTASDEFGNYIFRFSQDLAQLVAETDDVGVGEDLLTEIRPDLIIQLMDSLPEGVMYETAPYYNIPNVRRINLCVPLDDLTLPHTSCQGGRAIQSLGNLSIITVGTTLHADGTVSNTNATGPSVDHAAWRGTVDLFGCFLDTTPKVKYYTLRYRRGGETGWNFVNEYYEHPKQQPDSSWVYTKIGPDPQSLRINDPTDPKELVGAYLNIEDQVTDQEWQNTKRDRKLQIHTAVYQPVAGSVEFRIEGYDASGEKVPGAIDTIKLYIDNHRSEGDIEYVKMGLVDPGECAFFELTSPGQPLSVRYRVTDPEGFMKSYNLKVYRGSNTHVPTEDTSTGNPVAFAYQPVSPFRFRGTLDETLDPTGYVEVSLEPTANAWLPASVDFCAFSFELGAVDRTTNGYGTPGSRLLWRELVGISYTPPTP